ncbi:MAG: DUF58 domain-containing protein [Planctomycetes bacterium]|nr:DUF58 domain-containing protein [Planctomycetota bacterium]
MRRGPKNKYFVPEKLSTLGNLQLLARTVVEGYISGLHKSPFKGFSTEFAAYREYMPGDDLKHFDWKVYARSDKKYVKEYEEETNMRCTLLVDTSGSMAYEGDGISKFDYACYLAAALTYLMVQQRDQVGLVCFAENIRERYPARSSPAHMKFLLDRLEEMKPSGETGVAGALHAIATNMSQRGLIIVLSDLIDNQDAVMNALQHFRHDRHEVIVFNIFDETEIDFPFRGMKEFRDLETDERMQVRPEVVQDEYLEAFNEFLEKYRGDCRASGVDYQLVNTSVPFEYMLKEYIVKREKL